MHALSPKFACRWLIAVSVAAALSSGVAAGDAAQIDTLLGDLANADASIRTKAGDQLLQLGPQARAAILKATKSPVPAIAEGAAEVLLQLPWVDNHDSRRARQALQGYGRSPPDQRVEMLQQLAINNPAGARTAIRVAAEDPSPVVAWTLVYRLAVNPAFQAELAKSDAAKQVPAYRYANVLGDLRRQVEYPLTAAQRTRLDAALSDMREAALFNGDVPDEVQNLLLTDAKWRGDHARVLSILRSSTASADADELGRRTVLGGDMLLAYHAAFGPLPGLGTDAAAADPVLAAATLARVADRAAAPLLASICWKTSSDLIAQQPPETRSQTLFSMARPFTSGGWLQTAGDYRTVGRLLDEIERLNAEDQGQVNFATLMTRRDLAMATEDDQAAINALQSRQQPIAGLQVGANFPLENIEEEIFWRRWRIDRAKPNAVIDEQVIARVKDYAVGNSDCAIDIIPWLDAHGREAEADQLFTRCYDQLKMGLPADEIVDAAKTQPLASVRNVRGALTRENIAEPLNNLAWLCTRSNRNLKEAAAMQKKALTLLPGNPAYLDTLADIEFCLGNADEAVRLETAALRMQPGMPFFEKQLFRFFTAAQKKS